MGHAEHQLALTDAGAEGHHLLQGGQVRARRVGCCRTPRRRGSRCMQQGRGPREGPPHPPQPWGAQPTDHSTLISAAQGLAPALACPRQAADASSGAPARQRACRRVQPTWTVAVVFLGAMVFHRGVRCKSLAAVGENAAAGLLRGLLSASSTHFAWKRGRGPPGRGERARGRAAAAQPPPRDCAPQAPPLRPRDGSDTGLSLIRRAVRHVRREQPLGADRGL